VEKNQDNGIWSWPRLNSLTMIQSIGLGKSPFQIVYGRSPKGVVDLVKFPNLEDKRSVDASEFVEGIQKCMSRSSRSTTKQYQI
jgi:hypothetical protein